MPKLPGRNRADTEIFHDWYAGFPVKVLLVIQASIRRKMEVKNLPLYIYDLGHDVFDLVGSKR